MATSFEHHKKRIESYKPSWAHLCQSAEEKALWETVACTPYRLLTPHNFCNGMGSCHQRTPALEMVPASPPLFTLKACFYINSLWGKWGLCIAFPHHTPATSPSFQPGSLHMSPTPQVPTCHFPLAASPGGPRLQTYFFLLSCPLNLPLLIAHN